MNECITCCVRWNALTCLYLSHTHSVSCVPNGFCAQFPVRTHTHVTARSHGRVGSGQDSAHGNVSVVVDRTISYCETSALRWTRTYTHAIVMSKKTAHHNCGDGDGGGDSLSYFHCSVDVMKNIAKAHTLSRTCNRTIVHVRTCACACMLYFIYDRDSMFACCAFVSVRAHTHTHDCDKP